jgi:AcrR family transcriptional regulator
MARVAAASGKPGAQTRLLHAVTDVAAHHGYTQLTVGKVLAASGVSRATFYQYFSDIDDCFRSAYRHHADELVTDVARRLRRYEAAELAVLDALLDIAIHRPQVARVLMIESLAARPGGLLERDSLISKLEQAMTADAARRSKLDLPATILLGGVFRFLYMQLLEGNAREGLRDEVLEWAAVFARRPSQPAWSTRFAPALPAGESRTSAPSKSPPVNGTPRERILRATAATLREKGYRDSTVADIVGAAGVSRRGFYNVFCNKADAFMAAYEYAFELTVAACTPAFFSSVAWPERVWRSAHEFTGFLSREPLLAHVGFVECYALGPDFAARVHHTQLAFTLFLEEGYRQRPQAVPRSRSASALTAAAIAEGGFQGTRHGRGLYLRHLQPLAVYVALAPFIGVDEAREFVDRKLSELPAAVPAPL